MRKGMALLLAVATLAPGALAQSVSLQGQWDTSLPSDPSYIGVALIDAQHRVTFDARGKHGRGQSLGYAKVEFPKVEILLTDRAMVVRIVCTMTSRDRMECRDILPDGRFTVPSIMTRVGPGPKSLLTPASP